MKTPTFAIPPYDQEELQNLVGMKCSIPVFADGIDPAIASKITLAKIFVQITEVIFVDEQTAFIDFNHVKPFEGGKGEWKFLTDPIKVSDLDFGEHEEPVAMALRKANS